MDLVIRISEGTVEASEELSAPGPVLSTCISSCFGLITSEDWSVHVVQLKVIKECVCGESAISSRICRLRLSRFELSVMRSLFAHTQISPLPSQHLQPSAGLIPISVRRITQVHFVEKAVRIDHKRMVLGSILLIFSTWPSYPRPTSSKACGHGSHS